MSVTVRVKRFEHGPFRWLVLFDEPLTAEAANEIKANASFLYAVYDVLRGRAVSDVLLGPGNPPVPS